MCVNAFHVVLLGAAPGVMEQQEKTPAGTRQAQQCSAAGLPCCGPTNGSTANKDSVKNRILPLNPVALFLLPKSVFHGSSHDGLASCGRCSDWGRFARNGNGGCAGFSPDFPRLARRPRQHGERQTIRDAMDRRAAFGLPLLSCPGPAGTGFIIMPG